MAPGPYQWDENDPPGSQTRRLGDDQLRTMKASLKQAFLDGPMSAFPTTSHCTPGWARPFVYTTLAALQANTVATPYGRIGIVTADGANAGLWVELSTGWTKVSGA